MVPALTRLGIQRNIEQVRILNMYAIAQDSQIPVVNAQSTLILKSNTPLLATWNLLPVYNPSRRELAGDWTPARIYE